MQRAAAVGTYGGESLAWLVGGEDDVVRVVAVRDDAPRTAHRYRPARCDADLDTGLQGQLRADADVVDHYVWALRRGPRLGSANRGRVHRRSRTGWAGAREARRDGRWGRAD